MINVRWHVTMSLDGFIARPDDGMDWAFQYGGRNPVVDEVLVTTGAVLVGRRSYDLGRRSDRPELRNFYGGAWKGPEFVLTHRPPMKVDDPLVTFLSGDVRAAVTVALKAAGKKALGIIGADVAEQCIDAGLVDEIVLHVAPVLLGSGVRLLDLPGIEPVALETTHVSRAGPVTNLRLRVKK